MILDPTLLSTSLLDLNDPYLITQSIFPLRLSVRSYLGLFRLESFCFCADQLIFATSKTGIFETHPSWDPSLKPLKLVKKIIPLVSTLIYTMTQNHFNLPFSKWNFPLGLCRFCVGISRSLVFSDKVWKETYLLQMELPSVKSGIIACNAASACGWGAAANGQCNFSGSFHAI